MCLFGVIISDLVLYNFLTLSFKRVTLVSKQGGTVVWTVAHTKGKQQRKVLKILPV